MLKVIRIFSLKIIILILFSFCIIQAHAVTPVETYWNNHTVNSRKFITPEESIWYLSWRNEQYPFFSDFMFSDLGPGSFEGKTVLDYGCGPGNDIVNFLVNSNAKKIIGVDVSEKALELARERIALHKEYDTSRVELIKVGDESLRLPFEDNSIDFIQSCGVLMNLSHPELVLREFRRVLKPGGKVRLMVYNRDSIWNHLYVGYQKMVLGQPMGEVAVSDVYHEQSENKLLGLDENFKRSTDGPSCPISFNYTPKQFIAMGEKAGFNGKLKGMYFSKLELSIFKHFQSDLNLKKLPHFDQINEESRHFISQLTTGCDGYPKYHGENAGIGAVYEFQKPEQ